MGGWIHDLRGAASLLVRRPLFTAATIGTLALGIAANTTIFALVSATMLRKPAFPDPGRIVVVREVGTEAQEMNTSWPTFRDWRRSGVFSHAAAYAAWHTGVLGGPRPQLVLTTFTSDGFFDVFGISAAMGTERRGSERAPVVVVSDRYWREQLGGKPLAGRHLELEGMSLEVVAVMPPAFDFPHGTDLWVPTEGIGPPPAEYRSAHNYRVVARLLPGVELAQAERRIDALTRQVAHSGPDPAGSDDYLPVGAHLRTLQIDQ